MGRRNIIGVTGATGNIGGMVARGVAESAREQVLLVRRPSVAPALPGAEERAFSFSNDDRTRAALDGVTTLLMVSATESPDRLSQHFALIDAAVNAGVEHIVYTSMQGASPDAIFTLAREHASTEEHIRASGMSWTFLRDSFYADFLGSLPGEDGVIRGPAGDGRVAAVTRADVARVATVALLAPHDHQNVTYTLTGPDALSFEEVAATITRVTGRPVAYHDETVAEAYESRKRWPAEQWQYDAWVSTFTAIAAGEQAEVTGDVKRVTGRAPLSFAAFLRE